jgi:hypothetical protein
VNLCAKNIFNKKERNFVMELGQGTILKALYGLQKYSIDLYRPIGIKFLF